MDSGPDDDLSYNSDESEKVKLEPKNNHNTKPSKVIHIRNIPNEVTEAEIIHLGIPFGRVTNVLVLKGKNQAFLEMADEVAATSMVSYFTSCVAQLRGRAVYVQFSTHKELKTDQTHSNAVSPHCSSLPKQTDYIRSHPTDPANQICFLLLGTISLHWCIGH
ncbi:hypothetical protein B566_EDAN017017 [Ephemera danica]|nr:hypothetical protein B566_EDAN017017 [Ephemera danica]